jgi:transcriptional regulator with XRE-family HTH domain
VTGDDQTADNASPAAERLARRIKLLRNQAGLSQADLAETISYSREYLSMAERVGGNLPSGPLVIALDHALNAGGQLMALRVQAKAEQDAVRQHVTGAATSPPLHTDNTLPPQQDVLDERVRRSQQDWLRVRLAPGVRGRELTELAAWLHPQQQRAPGGHVLSGPGWLLEEPVDLDHVRLAWSDTAPPEPVMQAVDRVLPLTERGEPYSSYSRAVRDLVRPRLMENRVSYRLLDVCTDPMLTLRFSTTTFFSVFDTKQSIAHEFKAAWLASRGGIPGWSELPLRQALGDPFDPDRLLMSPGISTLTIRRSRTGEHQFVLHERDGTKVADGGGLCHVLPAGEFQPSSVDPVDVRNDFSLWHNIMREYAEEFLGNPEHDGNRSGPTDYDTEEPFRSFTHARAEGRFRVWHYGLVLEPLELGAIQLTVAVIDDEVFDQLFSDMVDVNDEGHLVRGNGRSGLPFTEEAIARLDPRLSASALTLLTLAWRDRHLLLGDRR